MSKSKIISGLAVTAIALALSGCTVSFSGGESAVTSGGIFFSANKGDTWTQKALIPTNSGKPRSLSGLDVSALVMDPGDFKALYMGSDENGMFFTYDGGENWQVATALGKVTVRAVAVDPNDKCTIYAAAENKVHKSTDCSRTWAPVYFDNDPAVQVTAITVDGANSNNVFVGLSRGDILRSSDKGLSWQTAGRLADRVEKIVFSAADNKVMFAGTRSKGLFRSRDSGFNWTTLAEELKEFKTNNSFRDLAISKAEPGLIILASNYGLIRSTDNGDTWSKIDLITPEKGAIINSVFIGPKDAKEIYYVTNTTFYRSLDGGVNWTTKKLPTTRAGWKLLIDPDAPNAIYLGVKALKK